MLKGLVISAIGLKNLTNSSSSSCLYKRSLSTVRHQYWNTHRQLIKSEAREMIHIEFSQISHSSIDRCLMLWAISIIWGIIPFKIEKWKLPRDGCQFTYAGDLQDIHITLINARSCFESTTLLKVPIRTLIFILLKS